VTFERELHPPPTTTIVTGAAGWLGTALVHALVGPGPWARAGAIRALVVDDDQAAATRALGATPFTGDVRERASLEALFAGLDGPTDVIHAAGVIHPKRFADFDAVNTGGTRAVCELALDHGVRRMVHVSSNSPFGTNTHPGDRFRNEEPYAPAFGYGASKMRGELAVHEAVERGLDAVIVRPPWFYGPYQPPRQTTFFRMVRTGRFPVVGRGDQERSMVYVGNVVQGVVRAELVPTEPGRGWWVADARPYTVSEIVATVGRALADEGYDVTPNRLRVPDVVGRAAEFADGLIQRHGHYHQQIHVLGEMNKNIACEIDAAATELGYAPDVELYEGMRRSIQWCRTEGLEL
jgi:nucleoside-diphosphate-sugar epimerase